MTASAVELAPAKARSNSRRRSTLAAPLGTTPWTRGAALVLAIGMAVGAIGLAVAWFGASGSPVFRTELIWIAIAVLVCAIATIAEVLWLLVGFRCLRDERRAVATLVRQRHERRQARRPQTAAVGSEAFVAAPEMARRHRPTCDVVAGKPVAVLSAADSDALVGCGMCGS